MCGFVATPQRRARLLPFYIPTIALPQPSNGGPTLCNIIPTSCEPATASSSAIGSCIRVPVDEV